MYPVCELCQNEQENHMPRVTIPEPEIKLYEDRFDGHDLLGRRPTGDNLSELVERIEDPLVIALDGAWGSGKSFFLKCWVGEHLYRYGQTNQTVYFDAFKHDYLDDPLVALTGAITDRFRTPEDEQQEQDRKRTQKLKKAVWAVSKAAGRIGLSAVTYGTAEHLGGLAGEVVKSAEQEARDFLIKEQGNKEAKQFWDAHHAKIAAMDDFRLALEDLTKPNDGEPIKLVIVVDELDRCRPDYALSLLEIIKHFFNVKNVHFVLGVNLSGLENSVRVRYGSNIDAATYLQKFYSVVLRLPRKIIGVHDYLRYFDHASRQMQIPGYILGAAHGLLKSYIGTTPMTPRMIQRILTVLALIPYDKRQDRLTHPDILVGAAITKVCAPKAYEAMRMNKLTMDELEKVFYLDRDNFEYWKHVLHTANGNEITFPGEQLPIPPYALQYTCENFLEVFDASALQIG